MQVILVRHGETASNRDRLALGRMDVPLNDLGLRHAAAIAASIAADSDGGLQVEAVYTSPLLRARQTAEPIARMLGLQAVDEPALIEMDVGEMDGMDFVELRARHPDFMRQWLGAEAGSVPMPGGESLAEVQERAWLGLEQLRERHAAEARVVAVTHNFVIRALVCRALGMDLAEFRRYEIDLGSITRIEFRGPRTLLTGLNQTCHLQG